MNIIAEYTNKYEMEMNGINSTHQHFDDIANLLSSFLCENCSYKKLLKAIKLI